LRDPRLSGALLGLAQATTIVGASLTARAEEVGEPIVLAYRGPPCTSEVDLFEQIRARSAKVRWARPGERARVFQVSVAEGKRGSVMTGEVSTLQLEGKPSVRTVSGGTCRDVTDALALVIAVAIDPDALSSTPPPAASPKKEQAVASPPSAGSSPVEPEVQVTVTADALGARLERQVEVMKPDSPMVGSEIHVWKTVCVLPCSVAVPAGREYRISGERWVPSNPFRLTAGTPYALDASMGSAQAASTGDWLVLLGFVAGVTGGITYAVAVSKSEGSSERSYLTTVGIVSLVGAGVALAVGFPLKSANRTRVHTIHGDNIASEPGPKDAAHLF